MTDAQRGFRWLIAASDINGVWHIGIGDPTPIGWFTVFAYLAATILRALSVFGMEVQAKGEAGMAELLCRVSTVFSIVGRGVVVVTDVATSRANFGLRVGDAVELRRSDGSRLLTAVRGLESATPSNPERPVAFLVSPEVQKPDVEPGAEIWRV